MEGDEFKIKTNMFKNELNNSGLSSTTRTLLFHSLLQLATKIEGLHSYLQASINITTTDTLYIQLQHERVYVPHTDTQVYVQGSSHSHTHTQRGRGRERERRCHSQLISFANETFAQISHHLAVSSFSKRLSLCLKLFS